MEVKELYHYYNKFRYGGEIFHKLMKFRVKNILLVSTFYDAFIFEEDGRLSDQIFGEYHKLNLSLLPEINAVPTGEEALKKIDENDYDLVITTMRIGEITPFKMADKIKEKYPDVAIILLLNSRSDIDYINKNRKLLTSIDDVFLWNGDSHIFLAILKYVEDKKNIDYDTKKGLVRVILVVEDSIYYYSKFLPILYKRLVAQTQKLISEELNDIQKNYRMRTIPKVILVHDYESAINICKRYRDYILCVVSDVRYPVNNQLNDNAGFMLTNFIRERGCGFPIILLSSNKEHKTKADKLNVKFLHKFSKSLLQDLDLFIRDYLGFGDFIFRNSKGEEIDRVSNLIEFEQKLKNINSDSLLYHTKRNDFSAWLIARGEILVAQKIRPLTVNDFGSIEEVREFLVNVFKEIRMQKIKGRIVDFDMSRGFTDNELVRMVEGSLGGKGRGIAFLNALFTTMELEDKFENVKIKIPFTAFIGTGEFDQFLVQNNLKEKLLVEELSDDKIKKMFLNGKLSENLCEKLKIFIKNVKTPITVRSSGLLEDSVSQPFAGIYETFMLPNNNPDDNVRLKHLKDAIKLVFSSVFLKNTKQYMKSSNFRLEEEKMAVIIQTVVGRQHGKRYYPDISGVAQSYNFYPTSYLKPEDGTCYLALGLGQWVVNGENSFRFCPKYPKLLTLAPEDIVKNSQTEFFTLCLDNSKFDLTKGEDATLKRLPLEEAEKDNTLNHIVSYWDPVDFRLRDGGKYPGQKVLTFADVVKYNIFPLSDVLNFILEIGKIALGLPVEIEFAITLEEDKYYNINAKFYVLQIRPISTFETKSNMVKDQPDIKKHFLYSTKAMGNGIIQDTRYIVMVKNKEFDNTITLEIKEQIKIINKLMEEKGERYILIGPGRWGSRDRFLGIPIRWADISMVSTIVEIELEDFKVDASQGTHFFHNLISSNIGYFYIPFNKKDNFIDFEWINSLEIEKEFKNIIIFKSKKPLIIKMFGKEGVAYIEKLV